MTYTLSLGGTAANAIYVTTMDKAGGDGDIAKAYTKTSLTFTPSKDIRAQFNAYWTNGRPTDAYMMLELGSTATTYATYNGDTFTADFGQTVYGGELNWNTGVLTVDRATATLTGEESWTDSGKAYYGMPLASVVQGGNMAHICTHFKLVGFSAGDAQTAYGTNITYKVIRAYVKNLYATLDDWKAYLAAQYAAGTPVQIAYKLAEPITIQLTPQDILALGGVNTLHAEAGAVTVSGRISPIWMNEQLKSAIIALGGNV